MKFLHYAALIATTTAVRLQETSQVDILAEAEKHVPSPEEVWEHFDKNGDDRWDLKETLAAVKGAAKYFGHKLPKGWKAHVKQVFKHIDTDNSGDICPKEMMTFMFDMIDSNDDGEWSKKEVFDAIEALAKFTKNTLIKGWKKKVAAAMEHVDTDNNGKVSGKEAMAAIKKYGFPDFNDLFVQKGDKLKLNDLVQMMKDIPHPHDVWNHFDKNGDGEWDLKEAQAAFKGAMEHFGHDLPKGWKKEVAKEFKVADKDNSGKVSGKEMMEYIWDQIDSNDNGTIDIKEVKAAIQWLADFSGNTLIDGWEGYVEEGFKHTDTNGDGEVDAKEAMAALKEHGVPDINKLFK